MIIVRLEGGMGNQLFQYAFGEALRQQTGEKVFYTHRYSKNGMRVFELRHFIANPPLVSSKLFERLVKKMSRSGWLPRKWLYYFTSVNVDFFDLQLPESKIKYLQGYWQSCKYFENVQASVIQHLKIITPISDDNKDVLKTILSCNSVSIHVRRGDYKPPYRLTTSIYYERAIQMIQNQVPDARFFVFSDDIETSKAVLPSLQNVTFVTNNVGKTYEDFRLMMNCQHNIIANSTFSWWAAWLNNNPRKIVITPDVWFDENDSFQFIMDDLLPPTWVKLPMI